MNLGWPRYANSVRPAVSAGNFIIIVYVYRCDLYYGPMATKNHHYSQLNGLRFGSQNGCDWYKGR